MRLFKHTVTTLLLLLLLSWYALPSSAYPAEPNNAALLYYQAFVSFPDNYNEISMPLDPSPSGAVEPNQVIRDYLRSCHNLFELTRAAAKIPQCDWGLRHSFDDMFFMPHLPQIRQLCFHVMTQAQVYAADKEYQKALEHCLIIHRIAQHIGDENLIVFLVSDAVHSLANKGIRQTLSLMPANMKILVELEQAWTKASKRSSLAHVLATEEQITLTKLDLDKDSLIRVAKASCGGSLDPEVEALLTKADPAFLNANRAYYVQSMSALRQALDESTSFAAKHQKMKSLDEQIASDVKTNPNAIFTCLFIPNGARIYALRTVCESNDNVLRTAMHLYKTKTQTGVLPEKLPAGLPKNAFTGKDFGYERTEDGFVLRTETKGLGRDKPRESVFKVK